MFTIADRDATRRRLLALAEADPQVVTAALTGSQAVYASDRWSDIDLAFGVTGDFAAALLRWTELLYRDFGALHHWDLIDGSSVYRIFLLPDGLEVDLKFTPSADFGPSGPRWRLVYGELAGSAVAEPATGALTGPARQARQQQLIGPAWHHVLHARNCIERGKLWQAEWLIGSVREHVLALGCLRLGHPSWFARGVDLLPVELTDPLVGTLVQAVTGAELRRALTVAIQALQDELDRTDPTLAAALGPVLATAVVVAHGNS